MRIALFGHFGVQNMGNECTLQAMLHNLRDRLPDAEIYSICSNPEDTRTRHNLRSVAINAVQLAKNTSRQPRRPLTKVLRMLFVHVPVELVEWCRAFHAMKGTDILAMTGTGMLTDANTSSFGMPYEIFKWACVARLRGCRVKFVSVGVGPFDEELSRFFTRAALSLADYRSYRDHESKSRLELIGFNSAEDSVIPDLAFSLPRSVLPESSGSRTHPVVVGVGVMNHYYYGPGYGPTGVAALPDATHLAYLSKMADFVVWLIERNYAVRILHGDASCDARARADLRAQIEKRGVSCGDGRIVDEDILSVTDLVSQIAATDVVVAPRFHNLVLALMLDKPVMSVSYDAKADSLLESFGLGKYRQPIGDLNVGRLIEQFSDLETKFQPLRRGVRRTTEEYREALQMAYTVVLGDRHPRDAHSTDPALGRTASGVGRPQSAVNAWPRSDRRPAAPYHPKTGHSLPARAGHR
jgi:polysaccharide pyruvyl transferase WcaK-like protein